MPCYNIMDISHRHSCLAVISCFIGFITLWQTAYSQATIDPTLCHLHTLAPSNGRRCYIAVNQALDWNGARNTCLSFGGHVVTVTSRTENDHVRQIVKAKGLDLIWLGTREDSGTWRWLDDSEIFRQGCFQDNLNSPDFISKRLNNNNNYDLCKSQCQGQGYKYGGIQNGVQCWCGSSFGRHGYSTSCNVVCQQDNTVSCGGKQQNDVFAVEGLFSYWGPGLPNNHLGYQSCGEMESFNNYLWNDAKCTETRGAICRIDNNSICDNQPADNAIKITTNSTDQCFLITITRKTWFQSRSYCNQLGGDLVTVDNQILNQFLVDNLMAFVNESLAVDLSGFWIGLTRTPWKWTTGEEFLFTSWESGDPNGNQQNCAIMDQAGLWQDTACDGRAKVICEIDTSLPTTTTEMQSTSPQPTTTTILVMPAREKGKHLPFDIDDKQLAAIVAGGVVMLIIMIVSMAVFCHCERKKRAKLKEEKIESKREKFFFGLGKEQEDMDTLQRESQKAVENKEVTSDNRNSMTSDNRNSMTSDNRKSLTSDNRTSIEGNDMASYNDVKSRTDGETGNSDGEYTSVEIEPSRQSGLSEKPDLIPESG